MRASSITRAISDFRLLRRTGRSVRRRFGRRRRNHPADRSCGPSSTTQLDTGANISSRLGLSAPADLHAGLHRQGRFRSQLRVFTSTSPASRATSRRPTTSAAWYRLPRRSTCTTPPAAAGFSSALNVGDLQELPSDHNQLLERRRGPLSVRRRRPTSSSAPTASSARFMPTAPSTASKQRSRTPCSTATTAAIYIGRNVALDANGTSLIGYGYTGSANSQNRAIQEVTFGFNQTIWRNPRYGAINFMGQYEWLSAIPGLWPPAHPRTLTTTPSTSTFGTLCRAPCRILRPYNGLRRHVLNNL